LWWCSWGEDGSGCVGGCGSGRVPVVVMVEVLAVVVVVVVFAWW
jgi:hypothetical protein